MHKSALAVAAVLFAAATPAHASQLLDFSGFAEYDYRREFKIGDFVVTHAGGSEIPGVFPGAKGPKALGMSGDERMDPSTSFDLKRLDGGAFNLLSVVFGQSASMFGANYGEVQVGTHKVAVGFRLFDEELSDIDPAGVASFETSDSGDGQSFATDGAQFTDVRVVSFTVRPGRGWTGVRSFQVGEVSSAVPEPATWATMLFGFGAIGGAMRRRAPARFRIAAA